MWGNRYLPAHRAPPHPSIPAYVGEPRDLRQDNCPLMVYPRVCGGTLAAKSGIGPVWGLSPRMRGNRRLCRRCGKRAGSIPAYAGEPIRRIGDGRVQSVYPRVCGVTSSMLCGAALGAGSIPAYAGEPNVRVRVPGHVPVYPRVCGGTLLRWGMIAVLQGLSSRMRGNRRECPPPLRQVGSIPAYAGKPSFSSRAMSSIKVYPRVCGGTQRNELTRKHVNGLSPRVRGNRHKRKPPSPQSGSIPACAGEPTLTHMSQSAQRVYPRVCGGTLTLRLAAAMCNGLSPRVRGNLCGQ